MFALEKEHDSFRGLSVIIQMEVANSIDLVNSAARTLPETKN